MIQTHALPLRWPARLLPLALMASGLAMVAATVAAAYPELRVGRSRASVLGLLLLLLGLLLLLKPAQAWMTGHGRALAVLLVWAAILVPGLAAAELYARSIHSDLLWAWPLQPSAFNERDRLKVWNRQFREQYGWYFREWPIPVETFDADRPTPMYLFKPNQRVAVHSNRFESAKPGEQFFWSSNSWGFRGPEFSVEKAPNVIRIVALGASTTEGSQGDQETYPYYLQQELERQFPGRAIEVINAGHHGQSVDSLLEILRQRVLPLRPDVILFYESANNHFAVWDFTRGLPCGLNQCWLQSYPGWYRWLYGRSAMFVLLTNRLGFNGRRPPPMAHTFDANAPNAKMAEYVAGVRQIAQEAKAHGSVVVLSSFITVAHEGLAVSYTDNPLLFDDVYKMWYPITPGEYASVYRRFNEQYASLARELGVPFADVAAEFPKDPRYFPFDYYHLSPEGNHLLAQMFARYLAREVLPGVMKQPAG